MARSEFGPRFGQDFSINVGTKKYIGDVQVTVVRKFKEFHKPKKAGNVALHEASHVVVLDDRGKAIKEATINPGAEYLGKVEAEFDPAGAVAAHANGFNGTSHDLLITKIQGYNPETYIPVAREILSRRNPDVDAIAEALEEKKTLGPGEIKKVFSEVNAKKKENNKVMTDVIINDKNGGRREIKDIPVFGGKVMLPGEWICFSGKKIAA